MKKIRVLQIGADNLGYGGRSVAVYNLTQHMDSTYIENDFLYFGNKAPRYCVESIEKKGGKIIDIGKIPQGKYYFSREYIRFKRMHQVIKNGRYDIVHIHADNAYEALKSVIVAKSASARKIFVHAHTTGSKRKGSFVLKKTIYFCQKLIIHCIDYSLACSSEAAKYLFGNIPKDIHIVKNGIDIEKFQYNKELRSEVRKKLGLEDNIVIGCVGRLSYQKNHKFLLEIFKKFSECNQKAMLMLIGDGELRSEITEYANQLGINDKILLLRNRQDVPELLQAMDLFCLTSHYEGFGIVNLEAQANGLPCIVSDTVPVMAKVNDNFVFINLNEPISVWIQAMSQLIKRGRESNLKRLAQNGFDINESALVIENLYKE